MELEALRGEFGELPRFLEIPPGPAAPPGWGGTRLRQEEQRGLRGGQQTSGH